MKAVQVIFIWKVEEVVDFYYLNTAMQGKDANVLKEVKQFNGKTAPWENVMWFIQWAKDNKINRYRMNNFTGKILGNNDQEIPYAVPKDAQLVANYVIYVGDE